MILWCFVFQSLKWSIIYCIYLLEAQKQELQSGEDIGPYIWQVTMWYGNYYMVISAGTTITNQIKLILCQVASPIWRQKPQTSHVSNDSDHVLYLSYLKIGVFVAISSDISLKFWCIWPFCTKNGGDIRSVHENIFIAYFYFLWHFEQFLKILILRHCPNITDMTPVRTL